MALIEDVRAFQELFGQLVYNRPGHLTRRKLQERIDFLQEELDEFVRGCDDQDLAQQADALVDLVYVALGTANMLGLPWQQLWDDVQRANLQKARGVGRRGHLVDAVKPPGWVGPQTEQILLDAGYAPLIDKLKENHRDDPEHQ